MIAAVAVPLVGVAVLAVEVQLARTGPDRPDDTPLDHDGRVGGGGDALRMVWLGDSTAAGVGASTADLAMPRRVATILDRPIDVVSLAVSGATISDVVSSQLPSMADARPDVVAVSIGANDVTHLTSTSAFRSAYDDLVAAVPDGALLVLLGVPDMGAPPRLAQPLRATAGLRGRQLDEVARAVAADNGALYIDIAGETGPTMRSDTSRYFAADRYHPSDDGYALWADAVADGLQPALERREVARADR